MGKVLHTIRVVGDVIDGMMFGGFAPVRVPLDVIDNYVRMDRPKLKKFETDENGNIVFKKGKDYKEAKGA